MISAVGTQSFPDESIAADGTPLLERRGINWRREKSEMYVNKMMMESRRKSFREIQRISFPSQKKEMVRIETLRSPIKLASTSTSWRKMDRRKALVDMTRMVNTAPRSEGCDAEIICIAPCSCRSSNSSIVEGTVRFPTWIEESDSDEGRFPYPKNQ